MHSRFTRLAGTAVLTGFTVASLFAVAPTAASADEQDPGVARISLLNGGVDVKRADSGDTVAAVVNAPLNAGDYLTTQDDSRAELQLDDLTELRVAPDTQLRFTTMTSDSNALQLAQGTVELRLFRGNGANPEIDTPNATVRPTGNGAFRVTVDNDGNAVVTARSGEATVSTQNDSQTISSGTSVVVEGNAGGAQFQSIDTVANDGFDEFNADRDRHEADASSYAYVNDQFVGAGDLDQYGDWQNVDGYGEVWHPHYASGWAPYQDGNWTWEPYYGWTWVSAEPWGWAPYHYGRWFYASNNGGWCWTPATQYFQPVYRPAQVAFFSFGFGGGGGGGGISIGFGNVGWVALGPTDPFRPWWGGNGGYGDRGYGGRTTINNITNITNITNINNYHNINSPGAIVAVRNTNFQEGNFTRRIAVTPAQLRTANITTVRGIVPIVPTTRNLAYNGAEPATKRYPLSPTFNRFKPVAARTTGATFAEQRSAISSVAQRVYPTEAKTFEREAPAVAQNEREPVREPSARKAPAISDESRTAPVIRGEAEGGSRVSPAERQPALEQPKPNSPWDRFTKPGSAGEGAVPKVTDVRNTDEKAERNTTTEQARPSYAQPDTSEHRTATAPKSAIPQVESVNTERSASSPWDRFGQTTRASGSVPVSTHATSRNDGEEPATHGTPHTTYSAPQTTPSYSAPRRSTSDYGDGSTQPQTHRYSAPASTTPRRETTPSYGSSIDARPVEHSAPAVRPAPAEHAAPAHAAPAAHPGSSGDHPDSHDKHN